MRLATTLLVFSVAALLSLGLVMLYSSSMGQKEGLLFTQSVWAGLGLVACLVATFIDYRKFRSLSWVFLGVAIALLVLVLIDGPKIKGAQRWLSYGGFSVQPSELTKLALIFALAHYADRYQRHIGTFVRGLVIPGLIIGVVLALIFVEPDRGTTMLLACVSGVMLVIAGVKFRFLIPPAVIAIAALAFSLSQDSMRSARIYSWLNLEETKLGKGMQGYQAMIALGSGGVTGRGLTEGRQKLGFVPEHRTDFIFSMIGEELGLVATLSVVLAFCIIVICGVFIASRAREMFGVLLCSGIVFLIGLQAFINIGVVTSALPNKGLALPFVSYGGSSLVVMMTAVGIVLSIARHAGPPAARAQESVEVSNPFAPAR